MSLIEQHIIDHCHTAQDVLKAASAVRAKRANNGAGLVRALKITAPEPRPARLTFLPPPPADLPPAVLSADVEKIIGAVCVSFKIERAEIFTAAGVDKATGALKVAAALCIRRLVMPRGDVCEIFGLADSMVREALRFVDSVLLRHTLTRYANLETVVDFLRLGWADECELARRFTIAGIIRAVCAASGYSRSDLISNRRTADIVRPRQVAMALAKNLTLKSLPDIGRNFGRDHTTVLHAVRKMRPVVDKASESLGPEATVEDWARLMLGLARSMLPYNRGNARKGLRGSVDREAV